MGLKIREDDSFKMGLKKESVWGVPPDSQGGGAPWLHGGPAHSLFLAHFKGVIFSVILAPFYPHFYHKYNTKSTVIIFQNPSKNVRDYFEDSDQILFQK